MDEDHAARRRLDWHGERWVGGVGIRANAGHRDLVRTADVDYALSWINAKAGIGSDPPACTATPVSSCSPLPKDL